MSSVILSQTGLAVGNALAGPIGGAIGQGIGSSVGQEIDNNLLFRTKRTPLISAKLAELSIQTATYGKMIPIIYGKVKIAGNIIWSSEVKEERRDHYQRHSKFSGKYLASSQYNYSISLAIAIGEGEIHEILRVWLNDQLIDPRRSCYRFYPGSEVQMPDPLIEAHHGHLKTPAFRGISYIVIENLQLGEFGNQIPNFLFEVKRKVRVENLNDEVPLEERIRAVVMIPGSGEFVYDTQVQSKVPKNYNPKYGNFNLQKTKINQNNRENKADSLVALDQLKDTCPNLQWVAPVVGWFANSTDAGECKIVPGVEYRESITMPDHWQVGRYKREDAYLISKNKYSHLNYGGSSNDLSVLRYLEAIKNSGYKIMFYPMIFIDQQHKPWRGRISGTLEGVKQFFYGNEGYINFILHYANLVKDKVDSFIIGSELIGLTKIRDQNNKFPAVDALIDLASQVKKIMGARVKITYAADWSEYHHTNDGWYNLDPLWSCDHIDFIGIDAYFPLTNATEAFYDEEKIIQGWHSGEGYEYYYADDKKTEKKPLKVEFAWKNIEYWWKNEHFNPDGSKTSWQAKQKKICFTEIGFPSVELASNQPNVFYSPDSCESKFPLHSNGRVDFIAQRQALSATEKYWRHSEFIEEMFIWCWDARPYPYWPDLYNIWTDGGCWSQGHWINGKLGLVTLQAVIQDLAKRAGLESEKIRAEELTDLIDGIVINNQESAKDIINLLKICYFFDSHEANGKLCFVKRLNRSSIAIKQNELVVGYAQEKYPLTISKCNIIELSRSVSAHYLNYLFDYQISVEIASNYCAVGQQSLNLHLPIILDPQKAKTIAEIFLQETWHSQFIYNFILSPQYIEVKPNDLILLENDLMKVVTSIIDVGRVNKITAISVAKNIYQQPLKVSRNQQSLLLSKEHFDPGFTELLILNLPILPYELFPYGVYLGVIGSDINWRGAEVLCPDGSYLYFNHNATIGVIDEDLGNILTLTLINGELNSKTIQELDRYSNLASIGEEIIQFSNAEFLGDNKYFLSGLKRKMFESKTEQQEKRFILLNNNLQKFPISNQQIGKKQEFIVTSMGHNVHQGQKVEFVYKRSSISVK